MAYITFPPHPDSRSKAAHSHSHAHPHARRYTSNKERTCTASPQLRPSTYNHNTNHPHRRHWSKRPPKNLAAVAALVVAIITGRPNGAAARRENAAYDGGAFVDELLFGSRQMQRSPITSMVVLPDGRVLALSQKGVIHIGDPDAGQPDGLDAEVYMVLEGCDSLQERGALSLAIHPDFAGTGYFYVYWSSFDDPARAGESGVSTFRVSRFEHSELEGGTGSAGNFGSETVLWRDTDPTASCCHYGGGMGVGPDRRLYFCTGDKYEGDSAQDPGKAGGKVHRLNLDGSIPSDNWGMIDGAGGARLDSVYAYGLRNPFQASWDFETGRFLIADVGGNRQKTAWEELNVLRAGANFGWPDIEGPCRGPSQRRDFPNRDCQTTANPLMAYPHGSYYGGKLGASITGGLVYRGHMFPREFRGKYLYGDYVAKAIFVAELPAGNGQDRPAQPVEHTWDPRFVGSANHLGGTAGGQPTAFVAAADGSVLYGNSKGKIRRIRFEAGAMTTVKQVAASSAGCPATPCPVAFTALTEGPVTVRFRWVFGDGSNSEPTTATAAAQHVYWRRGSFDAKVEMLELDSDYVVGVSGTVRVTVGATPTVTITSPPSGTMLTAGQLLRFDAAAVKSPSSTIGALTYRWALMVQHNEHFHPIVDTGSPSFEHTVETSGHTFADNIRYIATVTVTDPDGLESTASMKLDPLKVFVTLTASRPGIAVEVDGLSHATPFVLESMVGYRHTVRVPNEDPTGMFAFERWSSGLETATFSAVMPDRNGTTLTAGYTIAAGQAGALRINCGGGDIIRPDEQVRWISDEPYSNTGGKAKFRPSTMIPEGSPLLSERHGSRKVPVVRYAIPVPGGDYTIKLHFVESYWVNLCHGHICEGMRLLTVEIQGEPVLENFDVAAEVGPLSPCIKAFKVTVRTQSDGTAPGLPILRVAVHGIVGTAIINAIEVIPDDSPQLGLVTPTATALAAQSLVIKATTTTAMAPGTKVTTTSTTMRSPGNDPVLSDGRTNEEDEEDKIAVEKNAMGPLSIRINCGGGNVIDLSGLIWQSDSDFTSSGKTVKTIDSLHDQGSPLGTERYGKKGVDLKYVIPVPRQGRYRLTLWFVESWFNSADRGCKSPDFCVGTRTSAIAINGEVLLEGLDILAEAAPGVALSKSFTVDTDGANPIELTVLKRKNLPLINAIELVELVPPVVERIITTESSQATSPSTVQRQEPSEVPSSAPSSSPSAGLSVVPSMLLSAAPSTVPSNLPSVIPSIAPHVLRSAAPSVVPTTLPSFAPSVILSKPPSDASSSPKAPSKSTSAAPSSVSSKSSLAATSAPSSLPAATLSLAPSRSSTKTPFSLSSSSPSATTLPTALSSLTSTKVLAVSTSSSSTVQSAVSTTSPPKLQPTMSDYGSTATMQTPPRSPLTVAPTPVVPDTAGKTVKLPSVLGDIDDTDVGSKTIFQHFPTYVSTSGSCSRIRRGHRSEGPCQSTDVAADG